MQIALSTLFTSDFVAAQFNDQAADQASKGKTYQPLLTMLDGAYGLSIPAATVAAINWLNANLFALDTAPKLASGVGARATTVVVTQTLHAYAMSIYAGMHADSLTKQGPNFKVAALPAWADPVAIAAKKADRKLRKEAGDKAAAEANAEASAGAAPVNNDAPTVDIAAEARAAWAKFAPFLSHNALTVAERDAYIKALESCTTISEPVTAAEVKAKKAEKKAQSKSRTAAEKKASADNLAAIKADMTARAVAAVIAVDGSDAGAIGQTDTKAHADAVATV